MPKIEKILTEMEEVLGCLVDNAREMKEVSDQVISEEQLEPIQQRQAVLLARLQELDGELKKGKSAKTPAHEAIEKRMAQKLKEFQEFNAGFIENIKKAHGIIQFEKEQKKKGLA